jgi:protein phosphatase
MSVEESKGATTRLSELEKEFVFHPVVNFERISVHDLPVFVRLGRSAVDLYMIVDPILDLLEEERENGGVFIEPDVEALVVSPSTFDIANLRGFKAIRRDKTVVLGRHNSTDMARFETPSEDVSREHVDIHLSEDGQTIVIEDSKSLNGTLIGRKPLKNSLEQMDTTEPLFAHVDAYTVPSVFHSSGNQDAYMVHKKASLFAVFDGVGSQKGAALSANTAKQYLDKHANNIGVAETIDGVSSSLATYVRAANEVVISLVEEPGTTAVVAKLHEVEGRQYVSVAHVGDSRAYIFRDGILQPKTIDHTFYRTLHGDQAALYQQEQFDFIDDSLNLLPEELEEFDEKHILGNIIGMQDFNMDVNSFPVESGDLVVLTSDGVHDNLTIREMESVLRYGNPNQLAKLLVNQAKIRSGEEHFRRKPDDMTAVVVTI